MLATVSGHPLRAIGLNMLGRAYNKSMSEMWDLQSIVFIDFKDLIFFQRSNHSMHIYIYMNGEACRDCFRLVKF